MNEAVSESIMTTIGLSHRKGSVYVCILSIAMLITVIGLSSLSALRVERRLAGVSESVVKARVAATSFLEVALLRIGNDPTWRSTYTHNVWTTDETVDNVTYTFKLVDERDDDLANDSTQPVRLYAKATVGEAVRIYSVLLATEGTDSGILERRVAKGQDDAEEQSSNGNMIRYSSDLELAYDSLYNTDTVGIRFQNVTINPGTTIGNAFVQFWVDEIGSGSVSLTIRGEDTDNASQFSTGSYNITSRPSTAASVGWSPPAWSVVGQAGTDQRTPGIASVIQEIVDRSGWSSGNALVIIISGTGTRKAESYDGYASRAPLLYISPVVPVGPVSGTFQREVAP